MGPLAVSGRADLAVAIPSTAVVVVTGMVVIVVGMAPTMFAGRAETVNEVVPERLGASPAGRVKGVAVRTPAFILTHRAAMAVPG